MFLSNRLKSLKPFKQPLWMFYQLIPIDPANRSINIFDYQVKYSDSLSCNGWKIDRL